MRAAERSTPISCARPAAVLLAAIGAAACQPATLGGGMPTAGAPTATAPTASVPTVACTAEALPRVSWPLRGQVSRDFAVIAYLDQDPSDGVRDFMGHAGVDAVTYDGHDGIDIDVGGFRRMDSGVPVFAGLDGEVIRAEDGAPDRNTAATPAEIKARANDVIVRHASGVTVAYWHLRRGSVAVQVGDHVVAGQPLGQVGSSGQASGPHLHISAYACDGGPALDMMALGMFVDAPPYEPPHGLLRFDVLGPDGQPTEPVAQGSAAGQTVTFDLQLSAIRLGEEVSLTAISPLGAEERVATSNAGPIRMMAGFWWQLSFTFTLPGPWTLVLRVGDEPIDQRPWMVTAP